MADNTNIFQKALAEILGLPVDLTNAAITGVLKAVGLPEHVIENPVGGRAWLMDNTGITTDDLQAAAVKIAEDPSSAFPKEVWAYNAVMDAKQRFMERVKQGYSDMLIPDEEIASKELNKGHFGSGWLPDFAENASIMWNRELMRASKTPYTNTKVEPIKIDLQTSDFKKAIDMVPEENAFLDYFIQPANAPTNVPPDFSLPFDYEDGLKMYDVNENIDWDYRTEQPPLDIPGVTSSTGTAANVDTSKDWVSYGIDPNKDSTVSALESKALLEGLDSILDSNQSEMDKQWALDRLVSTEVGRKAGGFPENIKDAQEVNSIYYWDGDGEKHLAVYAAQLEHFKLTNAYNATSDESALTQAANWMESAQTTGMEVNFDEIGGATSSQLNNAWDDFKAATTTDEVNAALSNIATVSTIQPSIGELEGNINQIALDSVVPAGSYPSGLPSVNELQENIPVGQVYTGLGGMTDDQVLLPGEEVISPGTADPRDLEASWDAIYGSQRASNFNRDIAEIIPTDDSGVWTGLPGMSEKQVVLPGEEIIDQPVLDEPGMWARFLDSLKGPTVLGDSAYADTMIRDQMADEARKNTALMGTGPTMDIENLPLSTWEDTPVSIDAGDLSGAISPQELDDGYDPDWPGWKDNFPDDLAEYDLFPPATTTDIGGSLTAGPIENIFTGLDTEEQNALMTDNNLMTDYLTAREMVTEQIDLVNPRVALDVRDHHPRKREKYGVYGPFTEHEDYYPAHRAAANAAGFGLFNAWGINPAYVERQEALKTLMGVPLNEKYDHRDWISTFGPKGIANAADINARIGLLSSAGKPDYGQYDSGGASVSSGTVSPHVDMEPPSGA